MLSADKIQHLLVTYPVFLFSLVFHEYAHAWMGLKRGDDLAKAQGRLTLNPLPHMDPIGTFAMPVFLMLSNFGFMFGYAKPVPMNPRTSSKDMAIVALAGPISNIMLIPVFLAAAFAIGKTFGVSVMLGDHGMVWVGMEEHPIAGALFMMMFSGAVWNVVLAYFNMLPVPPLDGSKVLYYFLPMKGRELFRQFQRYSWIALLLVIFVFGSIVFIPVVLAQLIFIGFL